MSYAYLLMNDIRINPHLILTIVTAFFPAIVGATCIGLGCNCTISAGALNFGAYAPLASTTSSATSTVSVTCSVLLTGLNVSYVVSLSKGSSGTYTPRTMRLGTQKLNYNIYTNSVRTTIWGDGTAGTGTMSDSYTVVLGSVSKNYTLYGLIPASQNVGAGTYNDTITATVTF